MGAPSGNTRRSAGRERRRFDRFATRLDVSAWRDDLAASGLAKRSAQCRMELRDFSLDGLRAESPVRLKVNEHVTLRLPPNGRHRPLELTGRVVHCRRQEDRYQVGIQFAQTRESAASPWWQLPRLFSVAHEPASPRRPEFLRDA
ncbi:MAG: PilZ domain-containing protein [Planctomycetota bacterium]|nr:PilZ domain-containing protein [Planctomycetota bacterium]